MPAPTDALRLKTDAELHFYVENPQLYQPELVAAAARELRRRGVAPATPASATPAADYAETYFDEPARPRPWLVPALVVLGALGLGTGWYWWSTNDSKATAANAASAAARLSPDSLKLESVTTAPLPEFDVERDITQQLKLVPAAELRQVSSQQMRQYRTVSRLFWLAEHPTEFILNAAAGSKVPSYALLTEQIRFTEGQWHNAGNALLYSYKLPPTMADHLARMRSVAATERQVLEKVKTEALKSNPQLLTPPNALKHEADEALLEGLRRPAKPLEVHL